MTERFRKLPIEIEAVQWTGTNVTEMWAFASEKFDPIDPEDRGDDPEMTARVFDELHSTWVGMYDGQWVIKGVMGEFYPCADGVLRATYESAADDLAEVGAGRASTEAAGRIRTFLADWDAAYPLDSTGVLADIPASYNNGLTPCRELMLADLRAVLAERVTEYEAVPSLVAVDFTSQPTEDRIRQWREASPSPLRNYTRTPVDRS
jgi:hypothetical protein